MAAKPNVTAQAWVPVPPETAFAVSQTPARSGCAGTPPVSVEMTMERGPWFFDSFGGGWRFTPEERDGTPGTRAVWKYTYTTRPGWLRPVADRIGQWLLGKEIRARIAAFARACQDDEVLAAAGG